MAVLAATFEHLVDSKQGASKDEQMKALAANLQKRFADESEGVKEGTAALVSTYNLHYVLILSVWADMLV